MSLKLMDTIVPAAAFEIAQAKDISVEIEGNKKMLQEAIDNGEIGGSSDNSWEGTHAEWEALLPDEKAKIKMVYFTDDYNDGLIDDENISTKRTYSSKKIESVLSQIQKGENLLNLKTWVDGEYYSEVNGKLNVLKEDQRGWNLVKKIQLSANTEYTVSTENACKIYYGLDNSYANHVENSQKLTFTTSSSGVVTLKFLANSYPFEVGYVQLEKGSEASEYVEYGSTLKALKDNLSELESNCLIKSNGGSDDNVFRSDLNTLTKIGIYSIATATHSPTGTTCYGTLTVASGLYSYTVQTLVTTSNQMFIRHRANGTWNDWTELATTDKVVKVTVKEYTLDAKGAFNFSIPASNFVSAICNMTGDDRELYLTTWTWKGLVFGKVTSNGALTTGEKISVTVSTIGI